MSRFYKSSCGLMKKAIQGFSLIEVLVSLAIFTIVVTISVGSLMVLIDTNARARNTQEVMTNLTFTLDGMVRDMRTGTDYDCEASGSLSVTISTDVFDCTKGTAFSFNEGGLSLTRSTANNSRRIAFTLSGGAIVRRLGNGSWYPVTSPNTIITDLRFTTVGTARGDDFAPVVTIYVAGYAAADENKTPFYIETGVTQQVLDI